MEDVVPAVAAVVRVVVRAVQLGYQRWRSQDKEIRKRAEASLRTRWPACADEGAGRRAPQAPFFRLSAVLHSSTKGRNLLFEQRREKNISGEYESMQNGEARCTSYEKANQARIRAGQPARPTIVACMQCVGYGAFKRIQARQGLLRTLSRLETASQRRWLPSIRTRNKHQSQGWTTMPRSVNQTGQVHIRGAVLNEARERARALAGSYQSLWL